MCNKGIPLHVIAKETNFLLNICFHTLVVELITFDAYVGIAIHGFFIATTLVNVFYSYIKSSSSVISF